MTIIRSEWKILCSSHRACPDVIAEMNKIGFQKVKDTPDSPTSDISAILVIDDEQKIEQKAKALYEKFRGDIQRITISNS